jgi:hypothetical protein
MMNRTKQASTPGPAHTTRARTTARARALARTCTRSRRGRAGARADVEAKQKALARTCTRALARTCTCTCTCTCTRCTRSRRHRTCTAQKSGNLAGQAWPAAASANFSLFSVADSSQRLGECPLRRASQRAQRRQRQPRLRGAAAGPQFAAGEL